MKFSTAALLKAVDAAIESRTRAAEAKNAEELAEYEKAKAAWLASEHPAALRDGFKRLGERLRRGGVVSHGEIDALIGNRWNQSDRTFNLAPPEGKAKPNLQGLTSLRDFLHTVEGDEVSSSGLRDVGFRNLEFLFRSVQS